ncbi:unnamed protein product [Closterium sp. NIES-53]
MGTSSERRLYKHALVVLLAITLIALEAQAEGRPSARIGGGTHGAKRRSMQAATCLPSQLDGFTSSKILKRGLRLHWKPAVGNKIELAVEARVGSGAAKGWIAVGFTPGGDAATADAVIGQTSTAPVSTYTISPDGQVMLTNTFSIGDATLERSRLRAVIRFTRSNGDGAVPVKIRGQNTIIWAYDIDGEKAINYQNRRSGSVLVNLGCVGGAPAVENPLNPIPGSNSGMATTTVPGAPASPAVPAISYCPKSSLAGYAYSANLDGGSFVLHWKPVQGQAIQMAMEATAGSGASNGWFGMGWSRDGSMSPSYSVIKSGSSLAAYYINGYKRKNVAPTNEISLGAPSLSRSAAGSLIAQFTLRAGEGKIPLKPSGLNYIIWAYSTGNQGIGFHGSNVGWVKVDFSCAFWTDGMAPTNTGSSGSGSSGSSSSNNNDNDGNRSSWARDMNQASGKYYADQGTTYWEGVGQGVAELVAPLELKKRLKAAEERRRQEQDAYNRQVARQVYGPTQGTDNDGN